jgi:hypothetical protein
MSYLSIYFYCSSLTRLKTFVFLVFFLAKTMMILPFLVLLGYLTTPKLISNAQKHFDFFSENSI